MKRRHTMARRTAMAALILGGAAMSAEAQESQDQAEARDLVVRIRQSMREVNKLLLDGSSEGAASEAERAARKMEELLDEAENKSRSVVDGLDQLMQMAQQQQQQQQQQSGGGGEQQNQPKPNPQDSPQREKSQDPNELVDQNQSSEGEKPKPKPDEQPGGEDPKGNRPDQSPPKQSSAEEAPAAGETGSFEQEDTSGRWGVLPAKQAEDLQRHEVAEFPLRYRQWMDLYYRRVNKRSSDG